MFQKQKDHFVLDVTLAEEIQKSTSTELHDWSENVVNVEDHQFFKENCGFLSVIYLSGMKIISMFYNSITQYFLALFTACFNKRYLNLGTVDK